MNEHELAVIDRIVQQLAQLRSLLFITGAGISAESGIPTYRGIGGLYDVDTTEEGCSIEEALSGAMFAQRPALTWKYLAQIGLAVQGAKPNRAHEVIAEMEAHFERVWTLTQNIDGFHRAAGSQHLIEVHGNMYSLSCTRCNYAVMLHEFHEFAIPPLCPECNAIVRPDVVLFGEMLGGRAVQLMERELTKGFDMVFSIGTSSVFPYIQAPLYLAKSAGRTTVEINPSESEVSHLVDFRLPLPAAVALTEIWRRYQAQNE